MALTDRLVRMAIDPGDINIGVAVFTGGSLDLAVTYVGEHDMFYQELVSWLHKGLIDEVIVEEFRLYPDKAGAQGYSDFPTAECIGVIKYLCGLASVPIVMQGANIKKPMFAQVAARGIELQKDGHQHILDAQIHGWYRILKTQRKVNR